MSDIITDKYNQQAEAFKAEGGIAGGLKRGLQAISETPERVTYVEETLRASWVKRRRPCVSTPPHRPPWTI